MGSIERTQGFEKAHAPLAGKFAGIASSRHVLVVLSRGDDTTWKSLRNVPSVHLLHPDQLNTYDVLVSDDVVFTADALETFVAGPATGRTVTAAASSAEIVEDADDSTVEDAK